MTTEPTFRALGRKVDGPRRDLETFAAPKGVTKVTFSTDEITSHCPVTGQPDFSAVTIEYEPDTLCLESKSLKLYLWSFRDEMMFCEELAAQIARDVMTATDSHNVRVSLKQNARGGLTLSAEAFLEKTSSSPSKDG